jgi:hypothetical protein
MLAGSIPLPANYIICLFKLNVQMVDLLPLSHFVVSFLRYNIHPFMPSPSTPNYFAVQLLKGSLECFIDGTNNWMAPGLWSIHLQFHKLRK